MTARTTTRMRHEKARRRNLTVVDKRRPAPNYLSILFACDDFEDFVSASPDDHIKVFLQGVESTGGKPAMRDYTPRSFDPDKGEFVIEFALHEDPGPATRWALDAKIGDRLQIGGPRGSVVISDAYDWYWLVGDETAIPAIARWLEENPGQRIRAMLAVAGPEEQVPLPLSETHEVHWVHRPAGQAADPGALEAAVGAMSLPPGDGFVWIAAEAGVAKAVREALLEKGHPLDQLKARGYWVAGEADSTARFD